MPTGVLSVSPWITSTFSIGTPSFSAISCANVVSWPWPWVWVPVSTCTMPVWLKRTLALSHRPTPQPSEPTTADGAMPQASM